MNTVKTFLEKDIEQTPQWLLNFKPGDTLDVDEMFKSRIVYYPGSRYDGQAIRTFNSARYAHVFIYVDYNVSREDLERKITRDGCLKGYKLLDLQDISKEKLTPNKWIPTVDAAPQKWMRFVDTSVVPYCIAAVFERNPEFGDEHGSQRIVVIFLFADGIATYDALFASRGKAPDVLLIQDHGFGLNWASFGKNSILERIARRSGALPKYICVEKRNSWNGYELIENLEPEIGGMHGNTRFLFKQSDIDIITRRRHAMFNYPLTISNGHYLIEIDNRFYLIDTGSPVSYTVDRNIREISIMGSNFGLDIIRFSLIFVT